ncbi:MAG: urea ABC transporter permease subunit UrtB [Methylobacter sp.]
MKKKRSVWSSCLIKLFSLIIFISSATFADNQISQEIKTGSEAIVPEDAPPFENLVNQFKEGDFSQKMEVIKQITLLNDKRARLVFESLVNDRLFYSKDANQRVYSGETTSSGYRVIDVITGQVIGEVNQDSVSKIKVNNRLRKMLRTSLAQLDMSVKDAAIRLKAVKSIGNDLNEDTVKFLRTVLPIETDYEVRTAIKASLAMVDLHADDLKVRLDAIESLSVTMDSEYNTELKKLVEKDSTGNYLEQDPKIIEAATNAIKKIESRVSFYENLQTLFFGLSLGSVLVLAAIGLAITFGVMGVINMAHGELIMLGAYTTYVVQLLMPNNIDISLFIAIPAAFAVSGLFGILIERGVIRFLYGRPLETLLATFGISLVLQQLVRTVFSPLNRSVTTPSWMSGSLEINSVLTLTLNRLYIIGFTLVVFLILLAVLKKTRLGLEVRAVSQNRSMAKAMGIKTEWVDAMTFGLGSGIAGVAGVALSQLTNVGPNLGQSYIIDSFMVVVFGGVGNLWGAMISGLSLGLANKLLEPYAGAVLAKILVLLFIILFIQKRPRGLFPQKGRAAEG